MTILSLFAVLVLHPALLEHQVSGVSG